MIHVVWTSLPAAGKAASFERGRRGGRARLFLESPGHRGTRLPKGPDKTYLTVDGWLDRASIRMDVES